MNRPIVKEPSVTGRCNVTSTGPPSSLAVLEAFLILLGYPPVVPAEVRETLRARDRARAARAEAREKKGMAPHAGGGCVTHAEQFSADGRGK